MPTPWTQSPPPPLLVVQAEAAAGHASAARAAAVACDARSIPFDPCCWEATQTRPWPHSRRWGNSLPPLALRQSLDGSVTPLPLQRRCPTVPVAARAQRRLSRPVLPWL
jgi:hypothetical protein